MLKEVIDKVKGKSPKFLAGSVRAVGSLDLPETYVITDVADRVFAVNYADQGLDVSN